MILNVGIWIFKGGIFEEIKYNLNISILKLRLSISVLNIEKGVGILFKGNWNGSFLIEKFVV